MADQTKDAPRAPKRVALNMKATPALRAKIDAAAQESGLSVAQEVERRLLTSIEADERAGGHHNAAFLSLLGSAIQLSENRTGQRWTQDFTTYVAVRDLTNALLKLNRPAAPNEEAASRASEIYTDELVKWHKSTMTPGLEFREGVQDSEAHRQALAHREELRDAMRRETSEPKAATAEGKSLAEAVLSALKVEG